MLKYKKANSASYYLFILFLTAALCACSSPKAPQISTTPETVPETSYESEAVTSPEQTAENIPAEIATVKAYYEEKEKQDYILEFELYSVETDQTETNRVCSLYRDSDLAHERGWENEIFDENRFAVVKADYYVKYDGTLVPYSGGEITEDLWLIRDANTSEWQIVEIGFHEEPPVTPAEETESTTIITRTDLYYYLEDVDNSKEKKQIRGDELKQEDFTGCTVAVVDNYCSKIYEYLSGDDLKNFIDCLTQADISGEEYGELPRYVGEGLYQFLITLSTDEVIYIGDIGDEAIDLYLIIVNDEGYICGEETTEKLSNLYREARDRYVTKSHYQVHKAPESTPAEKYAPETTTLSAEEDWLKIKKQYDPLDDPSSDYEKLKQVNGDELKSVDFTDCSIDVVGHECFIDKIYECLSEERIKKFTDCIKNAEISGDERESYPTYEGGLSTSFHLTLNTGEMIFISFVKDDDTRLILINGKAYPCDIDYTEISEWYTEIRDKFYEEALNQ